MLPIELLARCHAHKCRMLELGMEGTPAITISKDDELSLVRGMGEQQSIAWHHVTQIHGIPSVLGIVGGVVVLVEP